ncbi:hypothetical protein C8R46DRAFT_1027170 [Mycena filopes]|nr:hypothetical protein C8R46DRAFT_1027170 [Mycena filopes]
MIQQEEWYDLPAGSGAAVRAISTTTTTTLPPSRSSRRREKSSVHRTKKISRTLALKCYKLEPSDLEGLLSAESPFNDIAKSYNRHEPLPLYTREPLSTRVGSAPEKTNTPPPPPSLPPITEMYRQVPAQLEMLEQEFISLHCKWLWDAATRVLSFPSNIPSHEWCHLTQSEKMVALSALLPFAGTYPRRPPYPPPPSPSFDVFHEVLAFSSMRARLVLHEFFGGRRLWFWDADHMVELFRALIGIIEAHGCGEDGWASARWEVYDAVRFPFAIIYEVVKLLTQHSTHLDGLLYRNGRWYDGATDWLRGNMELPGEHMMTTRQDNRSTVGREYNSLLPRDYM